MGMIIEHSSSHVVLNICSERMGLNKRNHPEKTKQKTMARWFRLFIVRTTRYVSLTREGVDFTVPNVSHGAMFCYSRSSCGKMKSN